LVKEKNKYCKLGWMKKINIKKSLLFTLALLVSISSFGQVNQFKLGNTIKFNKNNIEFSLKKPIPFEQSLQSYASSNKNLVVSFTNKQSMVIIQLYSTPIPAQFYSDADDFFSNKNNLENLMDQMFPKPINNINSYKIIKIGSQSFIEISLISHNIQKQTNWVTFYKNNLINILGTTTIDNFSNIESFLSDFKNSISIN